MSKQHKCPIHGDEGFDQEAVGVVIKEPLVDCTCLGDEITGPAGDPTIVTGVGPAVDPTITQGNGPARECK